MTKAIHITLQIPHYLENLRLDQALAQLLPDYSRTCLQQWIRSKQVTVNGQPLRSRDKVMPNDEIIIATQLEQETLFQAENRSLAILHEDSEILIINKPPGLVVHPAPGNQQGTLLNALLHHHPPLSELPRAGIVHRLDKNTSGLLVIAKTLPAHFSLVKQLQAHTMQREYVALVQGAMTSGGTIDAPIARHSKQRTLMAVVNQGKTAITHYRILKRFPQHTLITVQLETGRTHQIRVHMAHIGYPIVGDPQYGGRPRLPKGASQLLCETLQQFKRQALHAKKLTLTHPKTDERVSWEVPLPEDLNQLITTLEGATNEND